jgi:formate/nitrite transporter FocA (FNT family)
MFLIPSGILLGSHVSVRQWWWWNQIPVTLGNIAAGMVLTGIALWYTYARNQEYAPQPAQSASRVAVVTGD